MTEAEYARKLIELDRLLNDPDVPMQPARVWALLAEMARRDVADTGTPQPSRSMNSRLGDQALAPASTS